MHLNAPFGHPVTQPGREPLTIVEIDQDLCSRTYGVAPCTAVLGLTGTQKCYNGIASCQDEPNYLLGSPLILRFCTSNSDNKLPRSLVFIPSVLSVSTVPTRINLGSSSVDASPLGERAVVTVELRDHPYHDGIVDPYAAERSPARQGTFWGKWLARNPYYQGRNIRVMHGYVGQSLDEFVVTHFVIDRIDGPSNGIVRIVAKDPLKLLDDNRVKAPFANFGTLGSDLTDDPDTSPLWSFSLTPTGAGAAYSTTGIARIGSELVSFNRSGDTVTLTSRGLRNTVVSTHAAGDLFQQVLVISSQRVDLLLADLMINYGGLNPAWIPTTDWDEETDLWCSGFILSAWITEPTGVGQLVAEICENTGVYVWWDDALQSVRFRATRPFYPARDDPAVELNSDQHIVADSLIVESKPEERITQVWMYYAMENPAGSSDDPSNFARKRILSDSLAEGANRYGDKRVKRIFCRFLDEQNDATTAVVAARILDRKHEVPKVISFALDAKETEIHTGDVIRISHPDIVDLYGAPDQTYIHIVSKEPVDPGHLVQIEARPYITRSRYCFIIDDSTSPGPPNYSSATIEQKEDGGWIAPDASGFANGDFAYKVL